MTILFPASFTRCWNPSTFRALSSRHVLKLGVAIRGYSGQRLRGFAGSWSKIAALLFVPESPPVRAGTTIFIGFWRKNDGADQQDPGGHQNQAAAKRGIARDRNQRD